MNEDTTLVPTSTTIYSTWNLRSNKGHFAIRDNINSAVMSFAERLFSLRRFKTIGKQNFGTLTCVLCREVYYIVPISEVPLSEVPLYIVKHMSRSNSIPA